MISERTLRQWRKDSLTPSFCVDSDENPNPDTIISVAKFFELHNRILRLTQELSDMILIQKGR